MKYLIGAMNLVLNLETPNKSINNRTFGAGRRSRGARYLKH